MFKVYYKIPLCYLSLHSDGKFLTGVDFCDNKRSEKNKDSKIMYGYKNTNSDLNLL
ncbi:methylated-DNA--protein-cysteine methyltransferase [Campylobacter jejuni subsp. doylei]|nr:methylated-DNA--protein-cysteine methyltransferase [Campylobacter jejuni subsp. doylei]